MNGVPTIERTHRKIRNGAVNAIRVAACFYKHVEVRGECGAESPVGSNSKTLSEAWGNTNFPKAEAFYHTSFVIKVVFEQIISNTGVKMDNTL